MRGGLRGSPSAWADTPAPPRRARAPSLGWSGRPPRLRCLRRRAVPGTLNAVATALGITLALAATALAAPLRRPARPVRGAKTLLHADPAATPRCSHSRL